MEALSPAARAYCGKWHGLVERRLEPSSSDTNAGGSAKTVRAEFQIRPDLTFVYREFVRGQRYHTRVVANSLLTTRPREPGLSA